MITELLDSFVKNVGIVGLLVSTGLLIMIATQNVFEVDQRPRVDEDPAGGDDVRSWEWRYMSDYAQHARGEVTALSKLLKLSTRTALIFAVSLAAIVGIFKLVTWVSDNWLTASV